MLLAELPPPPPSQATSRLQFSPQSLISLGSEMQQQETGNQNEETLQLLNLYLKCFTPQTYTGTGETHA